MVLNKIPFEKGPLTTMIERLYKTMNAIDTEWSKMIKPAPQSQIEVLNKILKQHDRNIPLSYLLFLQAMGMNDNGLLEQEWDGYSEVNSNTLLENYIVGYDDLISDGFLPFSFHWTDVILSMKLSGSDNPPVYSNCHDELFSGSFEKYLFQMAFRKAKNTLFLYHIHCAASTERFRDILAKKTVQNFSWTKPVELMEALLKPYQLQKAWFSDDAHFYGISSEYLISVNLYCTPNITIFSDSHTVLQNMKKSLTYLFGDFPSPILSNIQ